MRGQAADGLTLGYRRAARRARDDDRLAHVRQCVFRPQRRRRAAERADAGADIKVDAALCERVELLAHRAVNARVARVQSHGGLSLALRPLDEGDDLFKRQLRAVVNLAARFRECKQLGIHQRTRVDHHICFAKEPCAPQRDEIRRAASGANKMYHIQPSLIVLSNSSACSVSQRKPYSFENKIAPLWSSPLL